jgi:hypothetical protein
MTRFTARSSENSRETRPWPAPGSPVDQSPDRDRIIALLVPEGQDVEQVYLLQDVLTIIEGEASAIEPIGRLLAKIVRSLKVLSWSKHEPHRAEEALSDLRAMRAALAALKEHVPGSAYEGRRVAARDALRTIEMRRVAAGSEGNSATKTARLLQRFCSSEVSGEARALGLREVRQAFSALELYLTDELKC